VTETAPRPSFRHLYALAVAVVVLVPLLVWSPKAFEGILRPMLRNLMALPSPEKNQGMLLQHQAFLHDDVIPVYGSSELTVDVDMRAGDFFRWKAKGFQVCPVGAAGNTTFLMAQKIAAQGKAVSGHKVAVILSSTWFRRESVPKGHVAGNFSPLQAISLLQNAALDEPLRQRFTARLLDFPTVLADHPLLDAYVHEVAKGETAGLKYDVTRDLVGAWNSMLSWEDELGCVALGLSNHLSGEAQPWRMKPMDTPLHKLVKRAEIEDTDEEDGKLLTPGPPLLKDGPRDEDFLEVMANSHEWDDYALLLDTLKQLNAEALVISVPLPGVSYEKHGLSRAARDYFYQRVAAMAEERGFRAETFAKHDLDQEFIIGATTHFTYKGWLYVDRLLDDFYHDRLPAVSVAVK
jgi:D-alanine transfer protein